MYDKKLIDDAVRKLVIDGDKIINRRTSEVVGLEIDCTCQKDKF